MSGTVNFRWSWLLCHGYWLWHLEAAVAPSHRRGKTIPFADHGLYEAGLLRVIAQYEPDLANSRVDAVVDVDKDTLAPEAVGDLFAGDELSIPLDQQDEQLHWEFLQAEEALAPLQPITGLVERELAEMEFLGRK